MTYFHTILTFIGESAMLKPITTEEEALAAVRRNGKSLEYVPENLKTAEVCIEAVRQNGWALQYVPKKLRTPELFLEALKKDRSMLKFVPEPLHDEVRAMLRNGVRHFKQ